MYICVPSARWVYLEFFVPLFSVMSLEMRFLLPLILFLLNLGSRWLTCTESPPQALLNIFSHHQKAFTRQGPVWAVFNNNFPPHHFSWFGFSLPLPQVVFVLLSLPHCSPTCSGGLGFHSCWIPACWNQRLFRACLSILKTFFRGNLGTHLNPKRHIPLLWPPRFCCKLRCAQLPGMALPCSPSLRLCRSGCCCQLKPSTDKALSVFVSEFWHFSQQWSWAGLSPGWFLAPRVSPASLGTNLTPTLL